MSDRYEKFQALLDETLTHYRSTGVLKPDDLLTLIVASRLNSCSDAIFADALGDGYRALTRRRR